MVSFVRIGLCTKWPDTLNITCTMCHQVDSSHMVCHINDILIMKSTCSTIGLFWDLNFKTVNNAYQIMIGGQEASVHNHALLSQVSDEAHGLLVFTNFMNFFFIFQTQHCSHHVWFVSIRHSSFDLISNAVLSQLLVYWLSYLLWKFYL